MKTPHEIRNELKAHFGNFRAIAEKLGVSRSLVSKWDRTYMGVYDALTAEYVTEGKFRAEDLVSPHQKQIVIQCKELAKKAQKEEVE